MRFCFRDRCCNGCDCGCADGGGCCFRRLLLLPPDADCRGCHRYPLLLDFDDCCCDELPPLLLDGWRLPRLRLRCCFGRCGCGCDCASFCARWYAAHLDLAAFPAVIGPCVCEAALAVTYSRGQTSQCWNPREARISGIRIRLPARRGTARLPLLLRMERRHRL